MIGHYQPLLTTFTTTREQVQRPRQLAAAKSSVPRTADPPTCQSSVNQQRPPMTSLSHEIDRKMIDKNDYYMIQGFQ